MMVYQICFARILFIFSVFKTRGCTQPLPELLSLMDVVMSVSVWPPSLDHAVQTSDPPLNYPHEVRLRDMLVQKSRLPKPSETEAMPSNTDCIMRNSGP
jgi:hypothetical protein